MQFSESMKYWLWIPNSVSFPNRLPTYTFHRNSMNESERWMCVCHEVAVEQKWVKEKRPARLIALFIIHHLVCFHSIYTYLQMKHTPARLRRILRASVCWSLLIFMAGFSSDTRDDMSKQLHVNSCNSNLKFSPFSISSLLQNIFIVLVHTFLAEITCFRGLEIKLDKQSQIRIDTNRILSICIKSEKEYRAIFDREKYQRSKIVTKMAIERHLVSSIISNIVPYIYLIFG